MSKLELKAAMDALKINQPYRLNQSPTFKPPVQVKTLLDDSQSPKLTEESSRVAAELPPDSEGTQEIEGNQDSKVTSESQGTLATRVGLESEGTPNTEAPSEIKGTQEVEPSLETGGSQESKGTSKSRGTRNSKVGEKPKKLESSGSSISTGKASKREIILTNERGESVRFSKKDLMAQDLVSNLKLSNEGYGSLSNRILEILFLADFDKAEHEIIEFIIRESIFWRQEWTDPLSGAEFERLSGITSASLWSHLKRLTDKCWVDKELAKVQGKGQACNRYRLNPAVWGPLLPKRKKDTEESKGTPDSEGTSDSDVPPTSESEVGSYSGNQSSSSLYEKHSLKTELKTSPSQAPKTLEERWSKMFDQGKKEREIFLNLLGNYGKQVWDHCSDVVDYLRSTEISTRGP